MNIINMGNVNKNVSNKYIGVNISIIYFLNMCKWNSIKMTDNEQVSFLTVKY